MLDRLTFLLEAEGVKIHWLTDGAYERSGLAPENSRDEPNYRRGPAFLPLKPGAWNRRRSAWPATASPSSSMTKPSTLTDGFYYTNVRKGNGGLVHSRLCDGAGSRLLASEVAEMGLTLDWPSGPDYHFPSRLNRSDPRTRRTVRERSAHAPPHTPSITPTCVRLRRDATSR
jgi:hypothetical protein